jgi:flavin-dependent dehydrogenase
MNRYVKTEEQAEGRRLLIIGGVAGGASCAARARRLSEDVEIVIFERGPYVSFANCGLPYYVGDVITDEKGLLVATPQVFRDRFNIEVRVESEVLAIIRVRVSCIAKDTTSSYWRPVHRPFGPRCRASICPAYTP